MKIAVIIDLWPPVIGGSQTHVWELSSKLVRDFGCQIDIFTRALVDDDGRIYEDNESHLDGNLQVIRVKPASTLHNYWGRLTTIVTIALKVTKEHRNKNYDLIHAHSILGGLIGKIATLFIKKPIIFTVHGSPNLGLGIKSFEYFIEKIIHTKIPYNQTITVGKDFINYANINKNIAIIPNGVNVKKFDNVLGSADNNSFKAIFVGRLDEIKGIETLIEAINIIKLENLGLLQEKKFKINLVGYGFNLNSLQKKVREYNLGEFILFKGKLTGNELIRAYKNCHFFILPSLSEGQPITFLEAMASKLPILSTFSADRAEIIDSSFGWKVEKNNPHQLANKLVEIMQLPHITVKEMGKNGYKKVSKKYTWNLVVKQTYEIYKSLLSIK